MKKNKVIIILGPTAIGKSNLGIKLAKEYSGEVISGDSMQVYKKLDIGTAKISKSEQLEIQHYLIDICDVTQRYTVKNFQDQSEKLINYISKRGRVPFIVGGTGFYLSSLVKGLQLGGDFEYDVSKLRKELNLKDKDTLFKELRKIDPKYAEIIDKNNVRRLIRALEINIITGKNFQEQENIVNNDNEYLLIGLTDNRENIYERINLRVDEMISKGLLSEARKLYDIRDKVPQAKSGIGYKEFFGYFNGDYSLEETIRLIKRNTRRFAKRQLTYFNNQLDVNWFDISNVNYVQEIEQLINLFLNK